MTATLFTRLQRRPPPTIGIVGNRARKAFKFITAEPTVVGPGSSTACAGKAIVTELSDRINAPVGSDWWR
ncbi:hypothetical protein AAFF_G00331440 [Aldrovandia affinis]|uniref:Uncharacterized protein n=1 Tax=Aldrovandia affinis TaxID=143900 RepID=A0AAD7WPR6_9TELE|nr:hypothetical protein AAFF_G00331440 [Aldrovandia affinis]